MKELESMYEDLGVSRAVYAYGEKILEDLKPRFAGIDRNAEYNQAKVLHAMQENRVDATCFAATTGYGYDDLGRDKLERRSTPRRSTPRPRSFVRRSPAARTPWQSRCRRIFFPETSC